MDPRKFRNALGRFPTGVVVVTARTQAGDLVGMTMSSFNSVSLDPPLVLFSIHRKAQSFAAWGRGIARAHLHLPAPTRILRRPISPTCERGERPHPATGSRASARLVRISVL